MLPLLNLLHIIATNRPGMMKVLFPIILLGKKLIFGNTSTATVNALVLVGTLQGDEAKGKTSLMNIIWLNKKAWDTTKTTHTPHSECIYCHLR